MKNIENIIQENNTEPNINYKMTADSIVFYNNNTEVGGMIFNVGYCDAIADEYYDSVDDFDGSIFRKFNFNKPIVNIEDFYVLREFQGQRLSRKLFALGINELQKKYNQFILRASSDNGFPNNKLVEIYNEHGFIPYQNTQNDGIIMYCIQK